MALTKHMTAGDLLRIRRLMSEGVTEVNVIQKTIFLHSSRIKEVLKAGLPKAEAAPVKKQTAKQKAQAAAPAAAKVDPVS
jgi:hypothetical protein